jgi:hypothetical protein
LKPACLFAAASRPNRIRSSGICSDSRLHTLQRFAVEFIMQLLKLSADGVVLEYGLIGVLTTVVAIWAQF